MKELCVGKMIAARRRTMGMTQQQLAQRLGVTNRAVSKWETGEGYPDIVSLPVLAEVLELSLDCLLCGEESPEARPDDGTARVQDGNPALFGSPHQQRAEALLRFENGCIVSYFFSMLSVVLSAGVFLTNSNFMPFYNVYVVVGLVLSMCMLCASVAVWAFKANQLRRVMGYGTAQLLCAVGAHFLRTLLPWMAAVCMTAVKIIFTQGDYFLNGAVVFVVLLAVYALLWGVFLKKYGWKARREELL